MGRKAKYTKEQKVQACKDYLRGKKSAKQIAFKLNPTVKSLDTHVFNWVKKYKLYGPSAFDDKDNRVNIIVTNLGETLITNFDLSN